MRRVLLVLLSLAFIVGGLAGTSFALPSDLVLDTYLHPRDTNPGNVNTDVIGNSPPFDFFGYRWVGSELEIYTNWDANLTGSNLGAYLGDIFFYTGDPTTTDGVMAALAVRDHSLSEEAGDNIVAGDLFEPVEYRYSDLYFPTTPTSHFGDNEFVTASGREFANFEVFFTEAVETGVNMISVDFSDLFEAVELPPDFDFSTIKVRMAQTCGNDVMASSVPEPATLLLLGTGLIGLAGFGRRKFKNR